MGDRVRYLAFLLDDLSRCSLLDWVRELGGEGANEERWVVSADHCTIAHAPTPEQLASFPWGVACEMRVLGVAGDARARAVHVEVPDFVPAPAAAVPHVTVRVAPDQSSARVSDDVLADALATGAYMATAEAAPLVLTGRLGGVTASDERVFLPPGADPEEDPEGKTEAERADERWAVRDGAARTGGASNGRGAGRSSSADGRRAWLGAGAPGGFETVATRLRTSGGVPLADPTPAELPESLAAAEAALERLPGELRASFPNVPAATLKDALDACGGDLDAAAVRLMEGAAEGSGSGAAEGGAERPSTFVAAAAAAAAETVAAGSFRAADLPAGRTLLSSSSDPELDRREYSDEREYSRGYSGDEYSDAMDAARRRQRDASAASARGSGALADLGPAEALRFLRRRHEEAAALARSRAQLSALSREAYARGDGATARLLSQRAKAAEARAGLARETASRASARFHNNDVGRDAGDDSDSHSRADRSRGGGVTLDVDLHGQSAAEAVRTTRAVLGGAARTKNAGAVRVVCGAGRHSAGGTARVGPAVRAFLEEEGVAYVQESAGTLLVPLGGWRRR